MAASTSKRNVNGKTFHLNWVIKNWETLHQNQALILSTNTEIKCQKDNLDYASFLIGFSVTPNRMLRLNWKLIRKQYSLHTVEAILDAEILDRDGIPWTKIKSEASAVVGMTIETETDIFICPHEWTTPDDYDIWYLSSEGSLIINLKLTLTNLPDVVLYSEAKEFQKSCKDEFGQNMAALLEDTLSSDVKIITKDKIELHAHKAILRARCPVFASMFGSDFLESTTGLINVDDITSKTMGILLKFWYSGELDRSWKDNDIVAEFTYAAGKYQMTEVLKMLDMDLRLDVKTTDGDVDLLKMVQNLSLQNAESRILKQVISKIGQANSGLELLDMFSVKIDGLDDENFAALQILKEFDDVMSEQHEKDACVHHVKLLALACKLGIKNVEGKLLKRIVDTVNKVTSANELFALFDIKNETSSDDSKGSDLLVRANPK